MREIKFRGRDLETGEFVFGEFGRAANTGEPIIYFIDDERNWVGATVDEDSVAQLVGYDKNGKEVYEGDTVVGEDGMQWNADWRYILISDDGFEHSLDLEFFTLKEDD